MWRGLSLDRANTFYAVIGQSVYPGLPGCLRSNPTKNYTKPGESAETFLFEKSWDCLQFLKWHWNLWKYIHVSNIEGYTTVTNMSFSLQNIMLTKTLLTSLLTNSTSKSAFAVTVTRSLSSGNKANTLIIGAPGSGKGTISNWIVRDFGLLHVSSGDLLRAQMRDGTELGLAAKSFIGESWLVKDLLFPI